MGLSLVVVVGVGSSSPPCHDHHQHLLAVEDVAGDDEALDLARALVDLEDLRVAVQLLHRVARVEAVAAEDLDGVGGALVAVVGGELLGDGGPVRVAAAGVDLGRGLVREQAGGLDAGDHVGDHEGDGLVLRDGLAHRLALLGVVARLLHRAAGHADGADGDGRAGEVEGLHGDLEAVADLAEHVLLRHDDVVELDAAGVAAALAHVDLLLAAGDARRVAVDDEADEAALALGKHEEPVGDATVGDPHLGAVDDPLVALLLGGRLEARDVGPGGGLRDAVGGLDRGLGAAAEVLLLLRVGARDEDRRLGEAVGLDGGRDAGARPRDLLLDDDAVHARGADAAARLGDVHVDEAELPRLLEDVLRVLHRLVVLGGGRLHHVGGELVRGLLDLALLGREVEAKAGGGGSGAAGRDGTTEHLDSQ
mmetsp:Transcript_34394/g.106254  ORF Transcript_34394/g.106254 Transcript_34394/m.106254 type:complete len:422 (-) Transcript_34394:21-1286(-)|eukprot:CAMPEP_0174841504 /NCGR_PEP_ID=MMETSP1114-20130205/9351_1 /TAXON_ID=312471 /ORGANISM="Neobodo designis, Strain CCAP 1951/1" /LENGTH=421 /DNA_ID=CAMNT_0016075689 /DNA_START=253 /DNA_END=1518 /DNA_ORIENTATION=-